MKPYLLAVKRTLLAAVCLENFDSQRIERHNKPEVEERSSEEVILNPVIVARNNREKVLVEPTVNSVRVSIAVKQTDDVEKFLSRRFHAFMMRRAEHFEILRRKNLDVR